MPEPAISDTDRLIARLAAGLRPVRRLAPPWRRALVWCLAPLTLCVVAGLVADMAAMRQRFALAPDLGLALLGAAATTALAGFAAFQTSMPDRSPRWALLPLPALALWLGSSGLGCLRTSLVPAPTIPMPEMPGCLGIILGLSVPFSLLIFVQLRRACPLRPNLTAALGGLAAASASATVLAFFHPYDASAEDLAVHAVAVLAVIAANAALGGRILGRR